MTTATNMTKLVTLFQPDRKECTGRTGTTFDKAHIAPPIPSALSRPPFVRAAELQTSRKANLARSAPSGKRTMGETSCSHAAPDQLTVFCFCLRAGSRDKEVTPNRRAVITRNAKTIHSVQSAQRPQRQQRRGDARGEGGERANERPSLNPSAWGDDVDELPGVHRARLLPARKPSPPSAKRGGVGDSSANGALDRTHAISGPPLPISANVAPTCDATNRHGPLPSVPSYCTHWCSTAPTTTEKHFGRSGFRDSGCRKTLCVVRASVSSAVGHHSMAPLPSSTVHLRHTSVKPVHPTAPNINIAPTDSVRQRNATGA